MYHFYCTLPISHHSSTQEMNHYVLFFFTALPRTIAPAPLLRLRDNYADRKKTGNCILPIYIFFFYMNGQRAANVYLSLTLVKGLLLFTDGYVNMVQHHLTDEVWDPASLFTPCLCFSFLPDKKKKSQLPTVPGVYSCQRLDCTATNQPLSGEAAASGRTGGYRAGCNFCQGYNHACLWMSYRNVVGVESAVMSHEITSPFNWFSKLCSSR